MITNITISKIWKGRGVAYSIVRIVILLAFAYVLFGAGLFLFQKRFIYHPTRDISEVLISFLENINGQQIEIVTEDGLKIHALFVPSEGAEKTVLFCHGNAGNLSHRTDSLAFFHRLGLNCLIFDYRGYGKSEGELSEQGTYKDARAAYRYLREQQNIAPENIIIFGRSLGAAIAAQLATQVPSAGVVLESGFSSCYDMGRKMYPFMPIGFFLRFKYPTIEYVTKINEPILIMHSPDDNIIPYELGQKVFAAANEPKQFVKMTGDHNNGFLLMGTKYENTWKQWLNKLE